jgi:D-alanine-D-alanine ligase
MNAGCYGGETWRYVARVEVLNRRGEFEERQPADYTIGYRSVRRPNGQPADGLFTAAWFTFPLGDATAAQARIKELLQKRIATQPLDLPNAGSVFRNPPGDHAARLIESCGLKGFGIGKARISEKHANFIVNPHGEGARRRHRSVDRSCQEDGARKNGHRSGAEGADRRRGWTMTGGSSPTRELGKVAVLMGGPVVGARNLVPLRQRGARRLARKGVDAYAFDPAEHELWDLKRERFDRVFIALHGRFGEDGTVQGALETMHIPYTGSGVMASALSMDKWRTKLVLARQRVPTPRYEMVERNTDGLASRTNWGCHSSSSRRARGSTIGITKVHAAKDLPEAYELAVKYDPMVMAEAFVAGQELTASVLGDRALPLIRIEAPQGNYDYQNKYFSDATKYHCPSGVRADLEEKIRAITLRAFNLLGCTGWGRAPI